MKKKRTSVDSVQKVEVSGLAGYKDILDDISTLLREARISTGRVVNSIVTVTYWEIGRRIVEYEQKGEPRAEYGAMLLKRLAVDLTARFGKGFGLSNLKLIRKFYLTYQDRGKSQTLSGLFSNERTSKSQTPSGLLASSGITGIFRLSWSHYAMLTILDDDIKRNFYEEKAIRGGWSVRQLERQIDSMLFERVALSRKKTALLDKAARDGEGIIPEDAIKDPYILDFLGLPEQHSEKDEAVVHYALGGLTNKIFASRYKLQLPDPEVLKREIENERRRIEQARLI